MVGSAVAKMVESVFSMKSAVATTNDTMGMAIVQAFAGGGLGINWAGRSDCSAHGLHIRPKASAVKSGQRRHAQAPPCRRSPSICRRLLQRGAIYWGMV